MAILLTAGAAETLSHCSTALAESTGLAESAPETDDRPVLPSAVALTLASTSNSTASQTFAYSAHTTIIDALKGEMVPPAQLNGSLTADRDFALYVDASQTQIQQLTPHVRRSSLLLADSGVPAPSDKVLKQGSSVLGVPSIQLQGVFKQEGSDTSARARVTTFYPVTPNAGFGAEVDLTTGRGFADSQETGLNLNELYFAGSLPSLPTLRFVVGLMDLTSYFDRNSFAKDGATHFFNSVFQTNPALAAAGIASRPGLLVNWSITDDIDLKATTFSSTRNLGDFHLDGFAGEVGVRFGTAIIRGTYVSSRDARQRSGFREIFDIPRSGRLGPQPGDREEAYGINGEVYIPNLKLGLFGRYGRYTNLALDASGTTYSAGLNFLDIFLPSDRLGLGYGRQLSNDDLRRDRGDNNPDVLELFYDFRITPNLRAAVMLQERNSFSDTVLGVRVRTDFDISSVFRRSR
ncbi:MAG: carbohydrate porin [Stenomitos rutilans HA7619-LM2]|jgi:hypothetical protein|nr:carbohydrate porin [Stenomitos rutilans HA7619-LM2]